MIKKPIDILTPRQKSVIQTLVKEPSFRDFYLTGGTALSAFYLGHRWSDDLDFFTENPQAVRQASPIIQKIARKLKARISLGRRFETLFECALVFPGNERLKMDFALDMPGRLAPVRKENHWGLQVDNRWDIACNKLSALYERTEPKDLVDVYFIHKKILPLPQLIRKARKKYKGLDDYGLAMAFFKVKDVTFWPRMVTAFDPSEAQAFFLSQARRLMRTPPSA
jgi:predicted nucleotidyltransferase component of viral defense system